MYLILLRKSGLKVMVECFQRELDDPPEIGSIVTVKHAGTLANGKLRSPMFWRERKDVLWEEICMSQSLTHANVCLNISIVYVFQAFKTALWTKKENHLAFFKFLGMKLG